MSDKPAKVDPDLIKILKVHLSYELDRIEAAHNFIGKYDSDENKYRDVCLMAWVAFCTHARNLREFFRAPITGDMVAANRFTTHEIDFQINEKYDKRINEQISHLKYHRVAKEGDAELTGADLLLIFDEIKRATECLRKNLHKNFQGCMQEREKHDITFHSSYYASTSNHIYIATSQSTGENKTDGSNYVVSVQVDGLRFKT